MLHRRLVIDPNGIKEKSSEEGKTKQYLFLFKKKKRDYNLLARCETLTGAHAGKVLHILDVLECGLHLFLQKFVLLLLGEHVVCSAENPCAHTIVHLWCEEVDGHNKNIH